MKENQEKQFRLFGELKSVDRSTAEVQEKRDSTPVEITNPSINQLMEQLNAGVCTLLFYKITDGTMRRMRCTLKDVKPVPTKYNRQGVMAVWDLDASAWRSFYPNRVFKLIRNEKTNIQ
jgi:hypothetical protein